MKIVVLGGNGLIGSKVVHILRARGHELLAASPSSGVDILTGAGLESALRDAKVVVDVTNSPSFEDAAVLRFFETAARNVLPAEAAAGVTHHIALSVVGADRLPTSGYLRAKVAQEKAIAAGPVPYTVLRATQFFEFLGAIANASTNGDTVTLTSAHVQPVAADDVAATLAALAEEKPANAILELGGPERIGLDEAVRRLFATTGDPRKVVTDASASYFGATIDDGSLTTADGARLGNIRFEEWLRRSVDAGRT